MAQNPNPYLVDFREQLHERFSTEAANQSMSEWVSKNTTLNKKPFGYSGYEFQKQILDDLHPDLSVIKPSQIGLTEIQLRKAGAFLTRNQGRSLIFVLPTTDMFSRMSGTRFKPMLDNDKAFNPPSAAKPIRRLDLYQIGHSFAYFVAAVEGSATSIPADYLMLDEIDLIDSEMAALFQSRLQGSDLRITQRFSTPTFMGVGVDAYYHVSDQHEYLVRCPSCNHYNHPKWNPAHIHLEGLSSDISDFLEISQEMAHGLDLSPEKSYAFCVHRGSRLTLGDPTLREWVARYPSRSARGYRITPFATPKLGIDYILKQQLAYQRSDATRRFFNTVLGESYDDASARLTETENRAMFDSPGIPEIGPDVPVALGIDVGSTCHVTFIALTSPKKHVFRFAQVPQRDLVAFVEQAMEQYNIVGGGIDRYPETSLANEIRDLTQCKILPVEYSSTGRVSLQMVKDELDNLNYVRGDRTEILDEVQNLIRKSRATFSGFGDHQSLLVHHFRSQVRIEQADTKAQWQKTDGVDHYAHSLGYGLFSIRVHNLQMFQESLDQRVMMGIEVVTPTPLKEGMLGMTRGVGSPIYG